MVDNSEKFSLLVRLGYATRGLVYLLLGYLALSSRSKASEGPQATFETVRDVPLGSAILYVMAAGLLAYAVYKIVAAFSDIERKGNDTKGIAQRVGYAASGIAHIVLAWSALQFARGEKQVAGGDGSDQAAASLLTWEIGGLVLGLIGLGFVVGATMQAKSAITASFMRSVDAGAPGAVCWIGRAGHGARAVVFLLIGWSLLKSAWFENGAQAAGLGDALMSLRDNGPLYTVVAAGLLMFGVFSLVVARFRIIPDVHNSDLKLGLR